MRSLSVKQPWADVIMFRGKNVENRTWSTDYRGPILIHAGKRIDPRGANGFVTEAKRCLRENRLGVIVGSAFLFHCSTVCRSPWHEEMMWGWYLADPVPLPVPIPWPGQLSLFDIDVRATDPPIRLCPRCSSNLPLVGDTLCGACRWYVTKYTDRFSPEPAQERRLYQEQLREQFIAACEGKQ